MQSELWSQRGLGQFHLAITPSSPQLREKVSSYRCNLYCRTVIYIVERLIGFIWNIFLVCRKAHCLNFILAAGLRLDYIPAEENIWPSCFLWISNHTWMSSRASPSITGFHSLRVPFILTITLQWKIVAFSFVLMRPLHWHNRGHVEEASGKKHRIDTRQHS